MLRERDVVSCFGIEKRIQQFPILKRLVLKLPFEPKAGLFQNARGGGIVRVRLGVDPIDRKFLETILYERGDRFRHDAVSPKFLTQPKAKFSDMSVDILTNANTDAANRRLTDVDAKICDGLLRRCAAQEFIRVVDRIRVRK